MQIMCSLRFIAISYWPKFGCMALYAGCNGLEHFEVFLISRFSWVADDTKIIHVEGGINTREIF